MTIFRANDLKRVAHDLKLLGQAAFNIVWNKGRTQILKAKHIPMQNLRPEKAIEGEIKAYYYSDDWSQYRKDRYIPRRIEAFTGARGEESQILVIKPYSAGYFYFSPVDYAGALQWAEIDEEIGTYHLTNIQNGFANCTIWFTVTYSAICNDLVGVTSRTMGTLSGNSSSSKRARSM